MTTKIFLIEHENSFLGYQAFKEVSGKMQFICDLEFLEPLEIIETYDEENETKLSYFYQKMKNQEDYFIKRLTFDQLNELAENFSEN